MPLHRRYNMKDKLRHERAGTVKHRRVKAYERYRKRNIMTRKAKYEFEFDYGSAKGPSEGHEETP